MAQSASLEDALAHLKKLDPVQYDGYDLEKLRQVNTISLTSGKITDSDFIHLTPLCQLDNIKTFDFKFNKLTGEGLKYFAAPNINCEHITYIDLAVDSLVDSRVDEYLVALNAFPNLARLNIDYDGAGSTSSVTGDFFHQLQLKKLNKLEAKGINLSEKNARVILRWESLELFNFGGTPLSAEVLKDLGEKKIDLAPALWELRGVKWQSEHLLEYNPYKTHEKAVFYSKRALVFELVTKEAFDWATSHDFGFVVFDLGFGDCPRVHGLVDLKPLLRPEPKDDL